MPTRIFPGRFNVLEEIGALVVQTAQDAGFNPKDCYALQLAVDEACTNIIEHGYGGESRGEIECSCSYAGDQLTVVLRDWGQTFSPEDIPEPNFNVPIDKVQTRGAGLFLIHKIMDQVTFEFNTPNGNTLTMVKQKS
ncbi:MAG: ATP-binding protein [Chloroflexota bacterium]